MEQKAIRALLSRVKSGEVSVDEAILKLKMEPFEDLGFAKPDLHRGLRQGAAEVIYGAGKTPAQIRDIAAALREAGQERVLITRMSREAAELVSATLPLDYHEDARIGIVGKMPVPDGDGFVVVGEKKKRPFFDEEGNCEMLDSIDLGLTVDERIADGYYFSKTIRLVKKLLENPELLEQPLSSEVDC